MIVFLKGNSPSKDVLLLNLELERESRMVLFALAIVFLFHNRSRRVVRTPCSVGGVLSSDDYSELHILSAFFMSTLLITWNRYRCWHLNLISYLLIIIILFIHNCYEIIILCKRLFKHGSLFSVCSDGQFGDMKVLLEVQYCILYRIFEYYLTAIVYHSSNKRIYTNLTV